MTRFTDDQYRKAIEHLQSAREQLVPDGRGCVCCGGSGHQAFECGHNPLVSMAMCQGIAERCQYLHNKLHHIKPNLQAIVEEYHELLHLLSGACIYMGTMVGPARVVLP